MKKYPTWTYRVSYAMNRWIGGPKDWSFCANMWQRRLDGKIGGRFITGLIDGFFLLFCDDINHCHRAWVLRGRPLKR